MKKIVYIFSMVLILGLSYNLKAQEVENPKEELIGKTWYLTKIVIDEEEMPFIPSESLEQSLLIVDVFWDPGDTWVGAEVSCVQHGSSEISFNEADDGEFYFAAFMYLAGEGYLNYTTSSNNDIHFDLFYDFWNNEDLSLGYDTYYPFHFTYSIEQHENHQSLIVINDAGYEAHYQNVPYMSVEQNEFSNLNIYPNPAKESFQIENLTEKSTLKIYDLSGKEIFEQAIHSSTENIVVTQLSSGLYFYGVFQEGKSVKTGKLIKE